MEDEIKEKHLGQLRPFLDHVVPRERMREWTTALESIPGRVSETEHAILCFHNVFYRRSSFFSCVDWDLREKYQYVVVT